MRLTRRSYHACSYSFASRSDRCSYQGSGTPRATVDGNTVRNFPIHSRRNHTHGADRFSTRPTRSIRREGYRQRNPPSRIQHTADVAAYVSKRLGKTAHRHRRRGRLWRTTARNGGTFCHRRNTACSRNATRAVRA